MISRLGYTLTSSLTEGPKRAGERGPCSCKIIEILKSGSQKEREGGNSEAC